MNDDETRAALVAAVEQELRNMSPEDPARFPALRRLYRLRGEE
jgi:hypothetical protein